MNIEIYQQHQIKKDILSEIGLDYVEGSILDRVLEINQAIYFWNIFSSN